jgi:hypothetical protein
MTIRGDGPTVWILDGSATQGAVEMILGRCEAEYEEIFSRLCKAIAEMQRRGDGDAMRLMSKMMQVAVNDITDHFKSKPVEVVKDATVQ